MKKIVFKTNHLKQVVQLVLESGRKWFYLNIVVIGLMSVVPIIGLYLLKLLFDYLSDGISNQVVVSMSALFWLIIALAVTEITGQLLGNIRTYIATAQGELVQDHIMSKLHKKSIELDLGYYETPAYFDSLHLAQVEAPKRTAEFINAISVVSHQSLSLLAVVALLVTYHWGIAVLLLIAIVPSLIVHLKSANMLYEWRLSTTAKERETDYLHGLLTQSSSAKEVRIFGFGNVIASLYIKIRSQLRVEMLRIIYWEQTRAFFVNCGSSIAFYVGFFFFASQTLNGNFSMGDIALFYSAFFRAQGQLKSVIGGISTLYKNNLFLGNLFNILELEPSIKAKQGGLQLSEKPPLIEFNKVSFEYPGSTRKAIHDITVSIQPGEHIAIVGTNGSGKSTFVKLLCRLYDRSSGDILINGNKIEDYDLENYKDNFSVLFQDYLQFGFSVSKNIWLGKVKQKQHDDDIIEAAKLSGAHSFIESLPNGYETILGKVLKSGEQLSQGEWQKVALARAIYRNSNITILDEPTSWMDPEAEFEFFNNFHKIAKNRTAIMISHRLSSVRMVDRIFVIENGMIVEMGSHNELMEKSGRYAQLFKTQALNYQ